MTRARDIAAAPRAKRAARQLPPHNKFSMKINFSMTIYLNLKIGRNARQCVRKLLVKCDQYTVNMIQIMIMTKKEKAKADHIQHGHGYGT